MNLTLNAPPRPLRHGFMFATDPPTDKHRRKVNSG